MSRASVRIIIVNYRTGPMVVDCLRSLFAEREAVPRLTAVVVDNASGDGSLEVIERGIEREGWGGWVEILPLEENGGFAAGNNAGIRAGLAEGLPPEYFMLLNPDTIVSPGGVAQLVSFLESHPEAGIAGSQLVDGEGVVQRAAHRDPSPLGELVQSARFGPITRALGRWDVSPLPPEVPERCGWVSGASMMVRRKVISTAGMLDEAFFLYFEEVDLCWRARRAGWEVWYVPSSRVVHLEGSSTGIQQAKCRRGRYWYESRRRFFLKHYGMKGLLAADALWATGRALLVTRRALRLGGNTAGDPARYSADLLLGDVNACLKGAVRGRTGRASVE
jgi:N-acetylglucosaminyl-diphospho-decaprenol L-rhamnosyltransferase